MKMNELPIKDFINANNVNITIGDTVYIYEYKDRKNISGFGDLIKVKVDMLLPKSKTDRTIIVKGLFENVDEDDHIFMDTMTGTVAYTTKGRFVETSEGIKYGSFYIDNKLNIPIPCLRKLKDQAQFFDLYAVFSIDKDVQIRTLITDEIIFPSVEDAERYIDYLDIKHGELHNGYIKFFANEINTIFTDFDIIINGVKYSSQDKASFVFNRCCKNKNSLNTTQYDFNKYFSLKHISFELDEIAQ